MKIAAIILAVMSAAAIAAPIPAEQGIDGHKGESDDASLQVSVKILTRRCPGVRQL